MGKLTKDGNEIVFLKPDDPMDDWDSFVSDSSQGCIFCYSWWLKAVCQDQFEIMILRQGSKILAGMPIRKKNLFGLVSISMPPFTQTLGVLFPKNNSVNYEKNISAEMGILKTFVSELPKFSMFNVSFHYNFNNWLPFYWAGFHQTTFYSYVLDLSDVNKVFSEFAYSKRKNIKKAEGIVVVKEDMPAKDFYENHKLTLGKQGRKIIYSPDLFYSIYEASTKRNAGKTWYATDKYNNVHAAIFIVYDEHSAYFLISSIDPDYRDSGAATLLVKHAIRYLAAFTRRFDFEGSMEEGIESSFRHFGARQVPYFNITRYKVGVKTLQKIANSIKSKIYY